MLSVEAVRMRRGRLYAGVFFLDLGQPDWTLSLLFNDRFAPGLAGLTAIWT